MPTVRDSELSMQGDELTSLEVAKEGVHAGRLTMVI